MSVNNSSPTCACRYRRSTMSLTMVCVLMLCAVLTLPADGQGMRLCGHKLTRTLQAVCANKLCGGFIENSINKRASVPLTYDEYSLDYLKHPHFASDSVYPMDDAREIQTAEGPAWANNLRKRDGIATECCERTCTYSYLKTFCCSEK
uniref:Insulin-like domain-containing protein n=1 Tax=Plectus sambesii TaxID=2011161 RepID=A0A914V5W6_9BILA